MLDGPVDYGDYVLGEVPAKGGGTHAVALVRSGMGTTLAATRTARLLEEMPQIDAVLMVGIAGRTSGLSRGHRFIGRAVERSGQAGQALQAVRRPRV
jgi:nucleoside phosphorylase